MKLSIAKFYPAHTLNYTKGRSKAIDQITVHHTAGMESTLRYLYQNPKRDGSAHFFVHPSYIEQYVDTNDTAWTNGNFISNSRSITIEVRGDWRTYYDQKTLDQLKKLFTELRKHYPKAKLTYHMDESDKPTACPANLKHKGYALKAWNESIKQGEDMPTKTEVRNAFKELLDRAPTDAQLKAYTTRDRYILYKNIATTLKNRDVVNKQTISEQALVIKAQKAEIEALKAQTSEDTEGLNKFGETLAWLLKRIGVK